MSNNEKGNVDGLWMPTLRNQKGLRHGPGFR